MKDVVPHSPDVVSDPREDSAQNKKPRDEIEMELSRPKTFRSHVLLDGVSTLHQMSERRLSSVYDGSQMHRSKRPASNILSTEDDHPVKRGRAALAIACDRCRKRPWCLNHSSS